MLSISLAVMLSASVTQDRSVEAFHEVELSGGLTANVHKGKAPGLKLTGETDDLAVIETLVKDGRLIIRQKGARSTKKVTAEITTATLDGVEASGGVLVNGDGLAGTKCKLSLSGGVQLDLGGMTCEALDIQASGGAGVKLAGTAKKLSLDVSGGVQLETRAMNVSDARIRASGGVQGGVAVADNIDAELSGGVTLKVKGKPKVTRAETSGAAKLSYE